MRIPALLTALAITTAGCSATDAAGPAPATAPIESPSPSPTPTQTPPPGTVAVGTTQTSTDTDYETQVTVLRVRDPFRTVIPDTEQRPGNRYIGVEVKFCLKRYQNAGQCSGLQAGEESGPRKGWPGDAGTAQGAQRS